MRTVENLLFFAGAVLIGAWLQASWNQHAFQQRAGARFASVVAAERSGAPEALGARVEARRSGVIGRLSIARLGLDAAVGEGTSPAVLDRAIGHVARTALPGEGGNVGLAGHRDTFFSGLDRLERGDRIRLSTPDGDFDYRVSRTRVVTPQAIHVLDDDGRDRLTLVTCYPLRMIGPAPDRLVIEATALVPTTAPTTSRRR